nr:hypothetical protein [Tanacetum cinerariifolium]
MVELMNQRRKAIAEMKAKVKRDKPLTLAQQKDTEQSAELQETTSVLAGAIIAAGDPISIVPSVFAASFVPAETPIAAGVSTTTVFLNRLTAEQAVPLRKSSRKKSMARRRTLPRPSQSESAALPFDEDDSEAKFKKYSRQVFDDDDLLSLSLCPWYLISVREKLSLLSLALETKAGDIMYMFVDKKYPILPVTIQRMLNHGLEIDRDPSGNDLTTAIQ